MLPAVFFLSFSFAEAALVDCKCAHLSLCLGSPALQINSCLFKAECVSEWLGLIGQHSWLLSVFSLRAHSAHSLIRGGWVEGEDEASGGRLLCGRQGQWGCVGGVIKAKSL